MAQVKWHSSDESLDNYKSRLDTPPKLAPVIFPFRGLWAFKGFARILTPGTLVAILGVSGGMKTAFIEGLCDSWRQMDYNDILWWGTEWTWETMPDRSIQRYGGASVEEMALHQLYLHEEKQEVDPAKRMGRKMAKATYDKSLEVIASIKRWPGVSHMMDEPTNNLIELLEAMGQRIEDLNSRGRTVRFVVFDYLQLMDMAGRGDEAEKNTDMMTAISLFCYKWQVIGVLASQVTKAASYAAKSKDQQKLQAESGQNFRADKPKLVLTLRPIMEGEYVTDQGEIMVAKNNSGSTGSLTVGIDPAHYRWIDPGEVYDAR